MDGVICHFDARVTAGIMCCFFLLALKVKWSHSMLQYYFKKNSLQSTNPAYRTWSRLQKRYDLFLLMPLIMHASTNMLISATIDLFKITFYFALGYTMRRRGGKNTQKNCTKKIFTTKIITMV